MTRPNYIFIVGLNRTGSTLTRNILNCSKDVGLGGESRFFRIGARLGPRFNHGLRHQFAKVGDLSTDVGARQVVDYIFSRPKGFWNLRGKNCDREQFLQRLLGSDRSERALLDLTMAFYAKDKPIRGEKTPAHIYFIPTLLEWFPDAKIIHTIRDPRAIYASNKRKAAKKNLPFYRSILKRSSLAFQLYSSTNAIINWLYVVRLHHRYQQLYPCRYYLSKYEDLISDPESSLKRLCGFLEIDFTEEMLQQTIVNSSYMPKGQVKGFNTSSIDLWREHIDPVINKWFVFWCKKHLLEFNYQP